MLKYTGHPLVDVGAATIAAFVGKRDPTLVTDSDLEKVVDYMTRQYTRQPLKSFLTVAFPNSGFTQPAFEKTPERRLEYARQVLHAYRKDVPAIDRTCVFTGDPAKMIVYRQHIPLLTGEDAINFFPYGEAGLPVSGEALLCIQAFPLGAAKCAGRLLAVHSDNNELTYYFARTFLEENRKNIQLAQAEGSTKMPETKLSLRTLLIDTLLKASRMQRQAREDEQVFSVTAFHLSNSGQDPSLDIYHLPLEVIGFLQTMLSAEYSQDWQVIVKRAWEVAPTKKSKQTDAVPFEPRRNWLYEDLFKLPDNATVFLRTYFLRIALRWAKAEQGDPRGGYSLKNEAQLVSWKITEQFLRRMMHMDKERVEQIRMMGDKLADYVSGQNDRRFFTAFFMEQRYDYFRTALIKANLAHVRRGNAPIVTLDPYITVFEEGNEVARADWRLARDLVLIRMIERLHASGWLGQNQEVIPDLVQESAES
jgi:CRISPR-associated protein Cst1